ncbi:helix-turn-helix domain-containing protein [Tamlana fucoidanivorans]|uniref:Helix-turn-helix domain-containing protein n=1 Tax=Allotamlana fucoidanivorans TaxID=2583814 RepID=A0A5C4SP92_9FLAO|nr:helix-turn-helix domain-containing protein [Tamlana fucoidanivorans]TNJ46078.1 helix-turn-helix domain-containing protein [Tamlana fucoidanivorans]
MGLSKKQRIKQINKMLLEMATGNFFYRLERSTKNDHLEAISISLNMLAEELQEALTHDGYVNTNDPMVDIVQMSFILDQNQNIQFANQQSCQILSVLHADLIGQQLKAFLTDDSWAQWQKFYNKNKLKTIYDFCIKLHFKSKEGLIISKPCYVTSFNDSQQNKQQTLLTAIHHTRNHTSSALSAPSTSSSKSPLKTDTTSAEKSKIRLSFDDIRKIRAAHDMITNNLDKDFPSLRDFALQIGTNEFKLKYGFRELYGTSVYRFLAQERLRKSKMLIQHTNQSLKTIAQLTGYKSSSHFSRAFKKHFGCAPSQLRTLSKQNTD